MSIKGPSEVTVKASRGRPVGGFVGLLRTVALIALVAGAGASVGLTLWAGHRNPSRLLKLLFAIWVLVPFMVLLLAYLISKRWSLIKQATLYCVTLILTLSSLAFYGDVVWRPRPQPAFVFLVTPFVSLLLMTMVLLIAVLISRRRSRHAAGVR
jgi:hypothetical protein